METGIKNIVIFTLPKRDLLINDLINEEHSKEQIIKLFKKLHSLGYGEYIAGKRGKGNVTKFIPNKLCPNIYVLEV